MLTAKSTVKEYDSSLNRRRKKARYKWWIFSLLVVLFQSIFLDRINEKLRLLQIDSTLFRYLQKQRLSIKDLTMELHTVEDRGEVEGDQL
jgi:hypothetical protein